MPQQQFVDLDNIKWKVDSNNPEHVDIVGEDEKGEYTKKRADTLGQSTRVAWRPGKSPCMKESVQLATLSGGVIGITTYFITSVGRKARYAAGATCALVFCASYGLCYRHYRQRLKFEYISQLFPPGHEDDYIV